MRSTILFLVVAIACYQNAYSKEIDYANNEAPNAVLLNSEANLHHWNEVKDHIRRIAFNIWNSIKDFARATRDEINKWRENVHEHHIQVKKSFEEHIEKMRIDTRNRIQNIIKKVKYTKECLHSDKPVIDEILKGIVRDTALCMAENIKKVVHFDDHNHNFELIANDTKFMNDTENKLNLCLQNKNSEECLQKVRKEALDGMDSTENEIIQKRMVLRNIAEEILTNITICSAKGIVDASNAIIREIERIITCVHEQN